MKKFILSAVFALACFTAHAKNEVIKNNDDKNPKNKAKVMKTEKKVPEKLLACRARGVIWCRSSGLGYRYDVSFESDDCSGSAASVVNAIANEICSTGVIAR